MTNVRFELAQAEDTAAVRALLKTANLPNEDIHQHMRSFILAKEGHDLIGCVGLEISGHVGLLRSLAVMTALRGQGIGNSLCVEMIRYARKQGVEELYLLTTDQAGFFEKRGFQRRLRESAPEKIQMTTQYRALCPSSAILMSRSLKT